jgi:hypothetical protein
MMPKSPFQLRDDARAYRELAEDLGGAVMSVALRESAERLEQRADAVERELESLLPPRGWTGN